MGWRDWASHWIATSPSSRRGTDVGPDVAWSQSKTADATAVLQRQSGGRRVDLSRRREHDRRFGNDIRHVAKIVDTCDLAVDDIELDEVVRARRLRIAEHREHLAP